MRHFDGLRVYRFNLLPRHRERVDRAFDTWAINYAHTGLIEWAPESLPPVQLHAPIAFWTWPGPRWSYGSLDDNWEHRFVSFRGARAEAWQSSGLLPLVSPTQAYRIITDPPAFRAAFDEVLNELGRRSPDSPRVVHRLEGLLLLLHEQPPRAAPGQALFAAVLSLAEEVRLRPERNWDFAAEARSLGCTEVHLRRLWKRATGTAPLQFLLDLRLARAAALLRESVLPVKIVAVQSGFTGSHYFCRLFRRAHGLSPGAYRRAHREIGYRA